jgi:replicative DNA helicase
VREKTLYRSLINIGTELQASAYAQDELPGILAQAHQALLQVANAQTGAACATMAQLMSQAIHAAEHAEDRDLTGLDTGFFDLNRLTGGWQPSDLIILAARPSMGKTALALQFAMTAGRTQALPVLVCSLEMGQGQLANRMLGAEARMDAQRLRRGHFSQGEWGQLLNASNRLSYLPLLVDDRSSLTVLDVRTRATRLQMDGGLAMIIIDYLQLMTPVRRKDSRQQEVSELSRELKILAKELNVPILALSQLNRTIEQRGDNKPTW